MRNKQDSQCASMSDSQHVCGPVLAKAVIMLLHAPKAQAQEESASDFATHAQDGEEEEEERKRKERRRRKKKTALAKKTAALS